MASSKVFSSLITMAFLSFTSSLAFPGYNFGWGGTGHFGGGYSGLYPQFYQFSCPQTNDIVMSVLERAIAKEPRMAASLLRLHFHDCFVQVIIALCMFWLIGCSIRKYDEPGYLKISFSYSFESYLLRLISCCIVVVLEMPLLSDWFLSCGAWYTLYRGATHQYYWMIARQ